MDIRAYINNSGSTKGMIGIFEIEPLSLGYHARILETLYIENYTGDNVYVSHEVSGVMLGEYIKLETRPETYNEFYKKYPELLL